MSNNNEASGISTSYNLLLKPSILTFEEIAFKPFSTINQRDEINNQEDNEDNENEIGEPDIDIYHYTSCNKIILDIEKDKTYYVYDPYQKVFVFFAKQYLYIIDSNGTLIKQIPFTSQERIISISCNLSKQFLLLVTPITAMIIDIEKSQMAIIGQHDKENYIAAFFINNQYTKITPTLTFCLLYTNQFILYQSLLKPDKNVYTKKKINQKNIIIDNYYYNNEHSVLVIQSDLQFKPFSFKDIPILKPINNLTIANITNASKFYLEIIYNCLYFVHLCQNGVDLYNITDLSKIKFLNPIDFEEGINLNGVKLQFCDNLILCYTIQNLTLYDIKQKNNFCIGSFDYNDLGVLIHPNQIALYDHITYTQGRFFKVDFDKEFFYKTSLCSIKDTFKILFHRKDCKEIISKVIQGLIVQFSVSNLKVIFEKVVKHFNRQKTEEHTSFIKAHSAQNLLSLNVLDNSNITITGQLGGNVNTSKITPVESENVYHITREIVFIPIINQDDLFDLFDSEAVTKVLIPEKIIKLMLMICDSLDFFKITVSKRFEIIFIKQIYNMISFTFIDCLIKSKAIEPTIDIAKALISFKLKENSSIDSVKSILPKNRLFAYNLGISILMSMKQFTEVFMILIMNNQFSQAIEFSNTYVVKNTEGNKEVEEKLALLCKDPQNHNIIMQYLSFK